MTFLLNRECNFENYFSIKAETKNIFYYFAKMVCNAENTKKYNVIEFLRFDMIAENVGIDTVRIF